MRDEISNDSLQVRAAGVDNDFAGGEHLDQDWAAGGCECDPMHCLRARSEHAIDEFAKNVKVCGEKGERIACVEFNRRRTIDRAPFFDRTHAVADGLEELSPMADWNDADLREMQFVNNPLDERCEVLSVELKDVRWESRWRGMISRGKFDGRTLLPLSERESKFGG